MDGARPVWMEGSCRSTAPFQPLPSATHPSPAAGPAKQVLGRAVASPGRGGGQEEDPCVTWCSHRSPRQPGWEGAVPDLTPWPPRPRGGPQTGRARPTAPERSRSRELGLPPVPAGHSRSWRPLHACLSRLPSILESVPRLVLLRSGRLQPGQGGAVFPCPSGGGTCTTQGRTALPMGRAQNPHCGFPGSSLGGGGRTAWAVGQSRLARGLAQWQGAGRCCPGSGRACWRRWLGWQVTGVLLGTLLSPGSASPGGAASPWPASPLRCPCVEGYRQ